MKSIAEQIAPKVAELVAEARAEDAAAAQAMADAAPGPLANVIALDTGIRVGRWTVRRFCDADYEMLKDMRHPFSDVLRNNLIQAGVEDGSAVEEVKFQPRGPDMWSLAWIFTRPSREVEAKVRAGGYDALKAPAKDEFGGCRLIEFKAILEALFKQVQVYWSPNLEYEPVPTGGKESAAAPNPTA